MKKSRAIGELIEIEVGKQMGPAQFAEKMDSSRSNIYNIFERKSIKIDLLKRISEVLNHNFFRDLAEDVDLKSDVEETEDLMKRKIRTQFFEMVPVVMKKMNRSCDIVLIQVDEQRTGGRPIPDFGMPDCNFTFTVGETFRKRLGPDSIVDIEDRVNKDGYMFEKTYNKEHGSIMINIPLLKPYSEKEYEDLFSFVFGELSKND